MKRYFCKECSGILPKGKIVCDKCGYDNPELISVLGENIKRKIVIRKVTGIAAVFMIVVILFVWDIFIDPPAWWRFGRQRDKNAIMNYVERTYPDTIRRKGGKFPLQMPAGGFENSEMYFELDGVRFSVSARDGEIDDDTYYKAKAEKYIRENYIDGFVNEKGLSPDIEISFVSPPGHYGILGEDELGDIQSFNGSILVYITQDHISGVSAPKEVGWFYDFYWYWTENCDLENCAVYLYYRQNNDYSTNDPNYSIWFKNGEKTFGSENDFFYHFTT